MTLHHALSDPPRVCWACIDDAVNAPDEPMDDHDPERIGRDPDTGMALCVCGHTLTRARTDRVVLTITHTEREAPGPKTLAALALLIPSILAAAGIEARVTAALADGAIDPAFGAAFDEVHRR